MCSFRVYYQSLQLRVGLSYNFIFLFSHPDIHWFGVGIFFCKGSKCLSYFISLVSRSIASNIAYCISANIYSSLTKCEELGEADRPVTPAQGCYSPIFGANMDTVQGRMTFILIRSIRRYTMEHTFKSAGRIGELHGQYDIWAQSGNTKRC